MSSVHVRLAIIRYTPTLPLHRSDYLIKTYFTYHILRLLAKSDVTHVGAWWLISLDKDYGYFLHPRGSLDSYFGQHNV
jgi:hypothetical protein